jgi:two-component system, cell cycle response regulator
MPDAGQHRVILVDVSDDSREVVARRLTAQGYVVEPFADPALGADAALASPPCALIADLWMPSISGVQLCRLLRAEPATAAMPVILRGPHDDPRSRFWAGRAGAAAYVAKGRMGELVRILANAAAATQANDGFFMQLSGGSVDIRERIARHLDMALFDAVIAAEVRALANCGSFERLFDVFSQFLSQVVSYRWMAISTTSPAQFALHHHPENVGRAEQEARETLQIPPALSVLRVEDEDARGDASDVSPIVCTIPFGTGQLGRLAIAPSLAGDSESTDLVALVARELGGPLRMAALMDESQRQATTDPLTGLSNRRALLASLHVEIALTRRHGHPLSVCLLDVDHFKSINDGHGHAAGDQVLAAVGSLLRRELRTPDVAARWGGEEFVVLFRHTDGDGGVLAAERIRKAIQALEISAADKKISVTVSIGVAEFALENSAETFIEGADRAMYRAKLGGRNRVERERAVVQAGDSTMAEAAVLS